MRFEGIREAVLCAVVVLALGAPGVLAQEHDEHHGDGGEEHAGHEHDATARHSFADVDRWAARFDDPARDEWQKPEEILTFLEIADGMKVADIGAGTGYFSIRLGKAVGANGIVWAVDIEPTLIDHIRERAAGDGLADVVRPVLTDPSSPGIESGSADLVLIVDTWHHIDDRVHYLAKLAPTLADGGRVAVVDFRDGELPVGPPPGHKLPRTAVLSEFDEAGWTLIAESDALPYQYLLVFQPGD